jgi:hypothetical protein
MNTINTTTTSEPIKKASGKRASKKKVELKRTTADTLRFMSDWMISLSFEVENVDADSIMSVYNNLPEDQKSDDLEEQFESLANTLDEAFDVLDVLETLGYAISGVLEETAHMLGGETPGIFN